MSEQPSGREVYGRMTGRKRLIVVIVGAVSGAIVAVMFAWFAHRPVQPLDLIVGAIIGGVLGLSASLGEVKRRRSDKGS
jgi:phosphate/sulfate permease